MAQLVPQVAPYRNDGRRAYPPAWVFYGGRAWCGDLSRQAQYAPLRGFVDLPWRVWPVVDVQDDNLGRGLIVRILGTGTVDAGGIDAVIDDWDLDPDDLGDFEEPDQDGPAGDFLNDYWFTSEGPDEPPGLDNEMDW